MMRPQWGMEIPMAIGRDAGRKLAALRNTFSGGRPKKRTRCPKCKAWCSGARLARAHCSRDAKQ